MTISMTIGSYPDSSAVQTPSSYYSRSRRASTGPASTIFTPFTSLSTSPTSPSCSAKYSDNPDDQSFPDFYLDPSTFFPTVPDSGIPNEVDEPDVNTPDRWVKRDSRLVRLTGKHPFNAEARLDTLFAAGFLTPVSLFYVRNHGAVPNIPTFSPTSLSPSSSPLPLPATEDIYPGIPPQLHVHSTWNIRIHGAVEHEQSFTIDDLKRLFKVVTLPITLVCAGNRRKEQNVASKTLGFNWGAAAVSTALFTGVYLCDVLKYVRPLHRVLAASTSAPYIGVGAGRNAGGNDGVGGHVIFEGADDDLPNGPYGTSQPLRWAMKKDKGMLLAWKMNGHDLEPDHGFPIRVVIPGQIGGRSVKWLRRIEVSTRESQHHLHFRDNKVLPTQITAQRARDEPKWWYDPKYIIRDLNVNSAIAVPNHNETLRVPPPQKAPIELEEGGSYGRNSSGSSYTLKGYAYAGGGKRVTIVEISLDEGESWEPADIIWPEDIYRAVAMDDEVYGELDLTDRDSCFCWCFWSFEVPIQELATSASIFVRAMDDSLALQPRDMYWNATGMMNNWWFRVAIHHEQGSDQGDEMVLRFEHPTLAGVASGGWMEHMKTSGLDFLNPRFGDSLTSSPSINAPTSQAMTAVPMPSDIVTMTNPNVKRQISIAEYTQQSSSSVSPSQRRAMFVVNGEVYDATAFLNDHPGGADSIWLAAGEPDASEDFFAIHSDDAKRKLVPFHIGTLLNEETNVADSGPCSQPPEEEQHHDRVFLDKRKWQAVTLTSVTAASHDSFIYSFAFPSPDLAVGLPVGQHVFVRLRRKTSTQGGGEMVQRAYTPVSPPNAKGHIELLVKLYLPSASFPSGGKMTVGLHELVIGDSIEMKGPLGSFIWEGRDRGDGGNHIRWKDVPRSGIRKLGLICGGSGITPILQVLRAALQQNNDNDEEDREEDREEDTEIWLLDANRAEQDILCRQELEEYSLKYGDGGRTITSGAGDSRPADNSDSGAGSQTLQTQAKALTRPQTRKARFRIHHTLTNPPEHWPYSTGRITDVMLQKHLPPPGDDALVLVCGPEGMVNLAIKPGLQRLGWNIDSSLVVF